MLLRRRRRAIRRRLSRRGRLGQIRDNLCPLRRQGGDKERQEPTTRDNHVAVLAHGGQGADAIRGGVEAARQEKEQRAAEGVSREQRGGALDDSRGGAGEEGGRVEGRVGALLDGDESDVRGARGEEVVPVEEEAGVEEVD